MLLGKDLFRGKTSTSYRKRRNFPGIFFVTQKSLFPNFRSRSNNNAMRRNQISCKILRTKKKYRKIQENEKKKSYLPSTLNFISEYFSELIWRERFFSRRNSNFNGSKAFGLFEERIALEAQREYIIR